MSGLVIALRPAPPVTREKRVFTLTARLCLIGVVLHEGVSDHGAQSFVLTRDHWTLEVGSLDAVEEIADELGAP